MKQLFGRKLSWGALLLLMLLAACNMAGDTQPRPAQSDEDGPSGAGLQALVLGTVDSPIIDELGDKVVIVPYDGSQNGSDYELVIFDGDANTAETIRDHEVIRQALHAHRWVLGVDVAANHKQDALGQYAHFATKNKSTGYLVRLVQDSNGHAGTHVLEFSSEGKLFGDVAPSVTSQTVEPEDVAAGAAKFIDSMMGELSGKGVQTQQVGDAPPVIPSDVVYYPIYFRKVFPWQAGGAQKDNTNGRQNVYYELNYNFEIFLDNKTDPQGDFQWISVRIDGEANPTAGTGNFVNMADDEKAWWQDRLKFSVGPQSQYKDIITSYGSSPETENGRSTVTSGVDFTVGLNKEGPSGEFGYHYEQERDITDWKIGNNSSGNYMEWDYRSSRLDADQDYGCANPYNNWVTNGFHGASCYPTDPSELSKNTLSVHAQAVWKTDKVLSEWVPFDVHSEQHVADTYCERDLGLICGSHPLAKSKRGGVAQDDTFSINMAAVVPIPIDSIAFSQNPAPAGQQVAGTITLKSAAQTNITVQLSSDSNNASVKPTVTIPKGQTSADFQVLTNANGLDDGKSTTATIKAFYADDFQAQLTVKNYGDDLIPPTTAPRLDTTKYGECAGDTGKWAKGYQVRYAAAFVGSDGKETDRGPWTGWANNSPYMLPEVQDVPTDSSGEAAARKVYRQFKSDYNSANPSAGVTLTGTLNDNSTTQLQDEDTAGTPIVSCSN